jgi:hypothetical protein
MLTIPIGYGHRPAGLDEGKQRDRKWRRDKRVEAQNKMITISHETRAEPVCGWLV